MMGGGKGGGWGGWHALKGGVLRQVRWRGGARLGVPGGGGGGGGGSGPVTAGRRSADSGPATARAGDGGQHQAMH
jgi:hypothetical protein